MRQLGTRRPTNLCNCKKGRSLARHPIRQIGTRCSENLCCGKLCIWTLSADAFWPNETTLVVRTWKSLRSTDHPRIFKDSTSFFLALDQPTPPDREVLTGLAERVTYQNAENGFCVVRIKARGQRELVTLLGHAAAISAGEWITATGSWVNDRAHGQQFKARFLKTSVLCPMNRGGVGARSLNIELQA